MTREQAQEIAKEMTYNQAIYNVMNGKCIAYKEATKIKIKELQRDRLSRKDYDEAVKYFYKRNEFSLHFSERLKAGMYFQVLWECIEHVKEMRNMHE